MTRDGRCAGPANDRVKWLSTVRNGFRSTVRNGFEGNSWRLEEKQKGICSQFVEDNHEDIN